VLFREQGKEGWVDEIREDVIEECSKYGGVVHINIDQVSQEGKIYIKCLNISTAMAAMAGLNGRYFAGNIKIVCKTVNLDYFNFGFDSNLLIR